MGHWVGSTYEARSISFFCVRKQLQISNFIILNIFWNIKHFFVILFCNHCQNQFKIGFTTQNVKKEEFLSKIIFFSYKCYRTRSNKKSGFILLKLFKL